MKPFSMMLLCCDLCVRVLISVSNPHAVCEWIENLEARCKGVDATFIVMLLVIVAYRGGGWG
jgi:hypothetical protein